MVKHCRVLSFLLGAGKKVEPLCFMEPIYCNGYEDTWNQPYAVSITLQAWTRQELWGLKPISNSDKFGEISLLCDHFSHSAPAITITCCGNNLRLGYSSLVLVGMCHWEFENGPIYIPILAGKWLIHIMCDAIRENPATSHKGKLHRNKHNNLKIVTFFFIFF